MNSHPSPEGSQLFQLAPSLTRNGPDLCQKPLESLSQRQEMYVPAAEEVFFFSGGRNISDWAALFSKSKLHLKRFESQLNHSVISLMLESGIKCWNTNSFNLTRVSPLLQDTINSVKARLGKSVQIQTLLRAFEARDRNLQESNFDRVNLWSVVNLTLMVLVSAVQVYLVRSLFEDKRKVRT